MLGLFHRIGENKMKDIQVTLKKSKDNRYVDMILKVGDMTFQVAPKFLNNKQKLRLKYLLSEVVKNEK